MNSQIMHLPKNCYSQKDMSSIDGAIIHFISAANVSPEDPFNLDSILWIFKEYKVSAHYLIDRDGIPIEIVPLPKAAYHAGKSRMNGRDRCNNWTIGIELMGGKDFDYTENQIATLKLMLAKMITEYRFPVENIQGHDYVRAEWNKFYPDKKGAKKYDPGQHFPWDEVRNSLAFVG